MPPQFLGQTLAAYPGNADVSSKLALLGDTLGRGMESARKQTLLSNLMQPGADGQVDSGSMALKFLAAGMPQEAGILATMANQQATRDLAQAQFGLTKSGQEFTQATAPFVPGPGGALLPRPGGPADPTYKQAVREPPKMSVGDITKLSEEGGKFSQVGTFATTFEPRFAAGAGFGDARNWVGRSLPEWMTDKDARDGASWWQNYDKYKNVVRNDLFGSALTPSEQAAFEKADIHAGMEPGAIQRNLATQHEIVRSGVVRKASAITEQGYSPKVVAKAYGLDIDKDGNIVVPKLNSTTAPPPAAAPSATAPQGSVARPSSRADYNAIPAGARYVDPKGVVRTKQ